MKLSLDKIKKQLELKRKKNDDLLKELKEKSIIYNSEKQKKLFLNSSLSILNRKRKLSDNENENNDISYNSINPDDYFDIFMNNKTSTKSFNNLNFTRPQRFSLNVLNKSNKKKLYVKNTELFTISKERIKKQISESNFNLSFSGDIEKTNNKINKNNSEIGLFSNYNLTEANGQISYFNINEKNNEKQLENDKNNDVNNKNGLFSSN